VGRIPGSREHARLVELGVEARLEREEELRQRATAPRGIADHPGS
jgi:hypothetical protein